MIYGYARVSTNKQADEGTSIDSQAETILARFPNVDAVFKDEGVSGSVPLFDRPAGKALRDTLRPGDVVVFTKLDRGFRSTEDFLTTFRLLEKEGIDISVINLSGGDPIGKNAVAKAMVSMLAVFAELERAMTHERTSEGRKVTRENGFHIGGRPPFGYSIGDEGQLIEALWRADAMKYMVQLRERGYGFRSIASAIEAHFHHPVSHATVAKLVGHVKVTA